MTRSDIPARVPGTERLRKWFYAYLVFLVSWLVLFLAFDRSAAWLLLLSLITYVAAVVHAYRVQGALHSAGLSRTGSWTVIAAAVLLNFVGGFVVPISVLWSARQARRSLGAQTGHADS